MKIGRLLLALVLAAVGIIQFYSSTQNNQITGEKQHVSVSAEQEIALGLQAAPRMTDQYGGVSHSSQSTLVDKVGARLIEQSDAGRSPYKFDFHTLADRRTINAFALPGGQVFITEGLLSRLRTEGQLAGVLAHEITHVVARHGAEHIAKQQLTQSLSGAAVLATYDPNNPSSRGSAAVIAAVAQLVNLKYGREDELEADRLGVRWMVEAGYNPNSMIEVMKILEAASGGGRQPEFFSTHPNPENRIQRIQTAITQQYPDGLPGHLDP